MSEPAPPAQLVDLARRAGCALEVGAGARFDTALALTRAGCRVLVTDVDARVLAAPAPLQARLLDAHELSSPNAPLDGLGDVRLVYAVRIPEELQRSAALLARRLRAPLVMRAFKDEWADVMDAAGPHVVWPGGWRAHMRG